MPKTSELIGARGTRGVPVKEVLARAAEALNSLSDFRPIVSTLQGLKVAYAPACRAYYSLAAASRRSALTPEERVLTRSRLFHLRASIERSILNALENAAFDVLPEAAVRSFFGASRKQGVSVRYPLAVCVPTNNCGGGCYAHDGRDREIHHVFRGVLNYWLGRKYEEGGVQSRRAIQEALQRPFDYAVEAAREDARQAQEQFGFVRSPRIRFAHVGEMVATPTFLHFLAEELVAREPTLSCVLYTRHPNAAQVDGHRFVINFTLEGPLDPRRRYVPKGAHIVCSAWDGQLMSDAHVNFPEHHVEKRSEGQGQGYVCPVVAGRSADESCDGARCDRCFVVSCNVGGGVQGMSAFVTRELHTLRVLEEAIDG